MWLHTLVPAPGSRTAHRAHVKESLSPTPPTPLEQTSRQKTEGPMCHTVSTSAIELRGACSRRRGTSRTAPLCCAGGLSQIQLLLYERARAPGSGSFWEDETLAYWFFFGVALAFLPAFRSPYPLLI